MPVLAILVLGHIGLWIALFNRINATGLHRKQIKAIEKGIVLVCLLLPMALLCVDWFNEPESSKLTAWSQYFMGYDGMPKPSIWSRAYAMIAIGYGLIAGPLWLMYRPQFHTARDRLGVLETTIDKHLDRKNPSWQLGSKARKSLRLPGNQLMHLEANVKVLRLDCIPERFVGMRIGHLSDIHLTGQLPDEFYRHALDWLVSQRIELLCLSGDIIDKHQAVPSLPVIFGNLAPDIPKLFVLGNHDRDRKSVV